MTTADEILIGNLKSKANREQAEKEQLERYGQRYTDYRNQYKLAGQCELETEFPLYLMLEQTYVCNLRCPMCIQGMPNLRLQFAPEEPRMTWETYEQIILEGEQHGCPSVSMMVNDEPLMVKDLPERIAFAKEHGFMDVFMTTNGVLFTEEKVKEVVDAGVTHILFSIDAATRETYEKQRLNGDYEKVIQAVHWVRDYRESRGNALPVIRASFVQTRINQHETQAFYDKFSDLVNYVEVQGFSSYYGHTDDMVPTGAEHITDFMCHEPWRKLIVRPNGDVLPCCAFYGYELVMGNIKKKSLYEIYNSPRMKKLRANFSNQIYEDSACASCSKSYYKPALENVKK